MVYLAPPTEDSKTHIRLADSKTREAPLRVLTIGTDVGKETQTIHGEQYLTVTSTCKGDGFWLDSKTGLYWIHDKGEWKTFVCHRVNEVLKLTNKEDVLDVLSLSNAPTCTVKSYQSVKDLLT